VPISLAMAENEARFVPDVCAGGDLQVFCKLERGNLWQYDTREPSRRVAFGLTKSSECCIMLRECERRK